MNNVIFTIKSNRPLTNSVYELVLSGDTEGILPGQFVNVRVPGFYLRRPISVCDCAEGVLTLVYKTVGHGTEAMAKLQPGDLLVVGCSSSEITGSRIGTDSRPETAEEVFSGIHDALEEKGIFLAAQCCEHLNRALVVEKDYAKAHGLEIVNAIPQPKAGGSFATAAYKGFRRPCLVEAVCADAGLDIGGTLIGMHLRRVAVPVRLSLDHIGDAILIAARTRPKYVGGARAVYDGDLG